MSIANADAYLVILGVAALTVTSDFANDGTLYLDTGSLDGGGSLTITGTLTTAGDPGRLSRRQYGRGTSLAIGGLTNGTGASSRCSAGRRIATLTFLGGGGGRTGNAGAFLLHKAALIKQSSQQPAGRSTIAEQSPIRGPAASVCCSLGRRL